MDWSVPVRRCRGCLEEGTSGPGAWRRRCRAGSWLRNGYGTERSCRKTVFQSGAWHPRSTRPGCVPRSGRLHTGSCAPMPGPGRFSTGADAGVPEPRAGFRRAGAEVLLLQLPASGGGGGGSGERERRERAPRYGCCRCPVASGAGSRRRQERVPLCGLAGRVTCPRPPPAHRSPTAAAGGTPSPPNFGPRAGRSPPDAPPPPRNGPCTPRSAPPHP